MGITLPGWQVRSWTAPPATPTTDYDVIVVGGGLSGCAAAVAAAERGVRVVLLEPTHLLGGQMSVGGVGTADLSLGYSSVQEQGLWKEIAHRIRTIYSGYSLTSAVARYRITDSLSVNAPVIDRVLTEMCQEAGAQVVRNCKVTAATVTSATATLTTSIGTITGDVVVEATEDGSLLALAGLPFRIGNITGKGTVLNGDPSQVRIQDMTQCAVVQRYDDGIPDELRMTAADKPPGYDAYRPSIVNNYPWKPWGPRPDSPDLAKNAFTGYRAYPDIDTRTFYTGLEVDKIVRTSLNHGNDIETHADFLTDPVARTALITDAINRTLSVIYYLQVELGYNWAVATDEGFAEGVTLRTEGVTPDMPAWVVHLPPILYIRESRRLVGAYTLTGRRIRRPGLDKPCVWSAQNLGVGTYTTDMHNSDDTKNLEASLGETAYDSVLRHGPFILPFGSFVPNDGTRLVAAEKNLSMSRLASAAVRVHPSVVAAGEAAGVIAALAARTGTSPKAVSYRAVQVSLLRGGALLLPYPIDKIPVGHPDYPAVSLALLNKRVPFTLDHVAKLIRLTTARITTAKSIGRKLVKDWEGPL